MENSYHIRMSLFPNLLLWQTLGLGYLTQVESSRIIFVRKAGVFPLEKVRQRKKLFIINEIRRKAWKVRSCFVLKDTIAKNFVANEHDSFTFVFYIQWRRRRPTDRLHLKYPFSRRNWRSRSSLFPVNRRRRRELRRGS